MNDATNLPVVASPPTQMQWPVSATERMALCRDLASARLVPPAFQKSPADIFLALNTIERCGFDFFLTIGECFVAQGKLGFSGKMAAAMLNSSGRLAERLTYTFAGEGDDRTVTITARINGEADQRTVEVRLGDAKTTNAQWTKQPDQQLSYAGARRWGRRHLPEVMLGMMFDDEVRDMIDVTPTRERAPVATVADLPPTATVEAPPQPVHATPCAMALDPYDHWREWATAFVGNVRGSHTLEEVDRWLELNAVTLTNMREVEPKMARMLDVAVAEQRRLHSVEAGEGNDA